MAILGAILGIPKYQFARDSRIAGVCVIIPRGGRHCISLTWVQRQFLGQTLHNQVELVFWDDYPDYTAGSRYKGPPHVAAGFCLWPPAYWGAMFNYSL